MLEKETKEAMTAPKVALADLANLEEDELLTSEEVAKILKCSTQTVRVLAKQGKLSHINVNTKRKLFHKKGIIAFLKRQHKKATIELQNATFDHMPWAKDRR